MKIGERRRIRIYKENGVLWKQKKRDREVSGDIDEEYGI
jgi:hypothetical protein